MTRWTQCTLAACLAAVGAGAAMAAAPVYRIEPIPDAGRLAPSFASAVNSKGWALGSAASGQRSACYIHADGVSRLVPDSDDAICFGLNDQGDVVGQIGSQAYWWPNDGPRQAIAGMQHAMSINNRREIAGVARFGDANDRAALYADGVLTDLGTLGGKMSYGLSINQAGAVTGRADIRTGADRPFRWQRGGAMQNLGHINGFDAGAEDINDKGHVLGYTLDDRLVLVSFIDRNDGRGMRLLPGIKGQDLNCHAMNNLDDVVCDVFTDDERQYAALSVRGKSTYRFTKLLDDSGQGWSGITLGDINDAGQVVGGGKYQGAWRAFIATPVTR